MPVQRPAATIALAVATTRTEPGPLVEKYRLHLDQAGLFRFIAGNESADDGYTAIRGSGGTSGAWRLYMPPDRGEDLTDASATIHATGGLWRVLPAATLTASRTLTLGTTNALDGYRMLVTRLDVGAYTLAIANGGAAPATLLTMPVSVRGWAEFYFDGEDWLLRAAAQMPA